MKEDELRAVKQYGGGGIYGLFYQKGVEDLMSNEDFKAKAKQVQERLAGLGYDFARDEMRTVLSKLEEAQDHVDLFERAFDSLRPVWKAIELFDSGDIDEAEMKEAIDDFNRKHIFQAFTNYVRAKLQPDYRANEIANTLEELFEVAKNEIREKNVTLSNIATAWVLLSSGNFNNTDESGSWKSRRKVCSDLFCAFASFSKINAARDLLKEINGADLAADVWWCWVEHYRPWAGSNKKEDQTKKSMFWTFSRELSEIQGMINAVES